MQSGAADSLSPGGGVRCEHARCAIALRLSDERARTAKPEQRGEITGDGASLSPPPPPRSHHRPSPATERSASSPAEIPRIRSFERALRRHLDSIIIVIIIIPSALAHSHRHHRRTHSSPRQRCATPRGRTVGSGANKPFWTSPRCCVVVRQWRILAPLPNSSPH